MSRGDGFATADVDSSYMDDAKMRALWQRLRDTDRMARAVLLHQATLLASWRHGERVTVTEAAPIWLPADDELVGHLQAVKLLDRSGKIGKASWTEWFGAADARRAKRRAAGAVGGQASGKARSSNAEAIVQQPSSVAEPVPTVPSVPTVESPPTPPSGADGRVNPRANGTNPRAQGTNPRAIAAELTRQSEQAERERKARRNARHIAQQDGRITPDQRAEMDERDAPLSEIPAERGAAYGVPA